MAEKRVDAGFGVSDICLEMVISEATFYKLRAKFSGIDESMMSHMKELEEKSCRLKKMHRGEKFNSEILRKRLKKC